MRQAQPGSGKPSTPTCQAPACNSHKHKHSHLGTHRQEDIHTNIHTHTGVHTAQICTNRYIQTHSVTNTQDMQADCTHKNPQASVLTPIHILMENRQAQTGTYRHMHKDTQAHLHSEADAHMCTHVGTHRIARPHPPSGSWLPAKRGAFCWVCTFHRL